MKFRLCMFLPFCRFILVIGVALLCGCIEVEERIRLHNDSSADLKVIIIVDPQYEALVLPKLKSGMAKDLPPGARIDFSQRINGKAAAVAEMEGIPSVNSLNGESTYFFGNRAEFMKNKYLFKVTMNKVPEYPVPHRKIVTLPGSIESVTNGKKISSDTVEFDLTYAKRGAVFSATSSAFALTFGGSGGVTTANVHSNSPTWLMPVSVGLIFVGLALLLTGKLRTRRIAQASASEPTTAASTVETDSPIQDDKPPSQFCTDCGAANAFGRKFCSKCGHSLE